MSDVVQTVAGKAGLFRDCSRLTDAGWQQEHAARQFLERWCHSCGLSACYGYGVTLKDDGVWSCADADCRASAEAEIARRDCPSPPAKPSKADAELDLFGEAA
jgi:hypothetical protein